MSTVASSKKESASGRGPGIESPTVSRGNKVKSARRKRRRGPPAITQITKKRSRKVKKKKSGPEQGIEGPGAAKVTDWKSSRLRYKRRKKKNSRKKFSL